LDLQKDGYSKTGCVNLLCAGFVQTTTKFALGAAIEPVSTTSQKQHFITVSMFLVTFLPYTHIQCFKSSLGSCLCFDRP